MKKLITMALLVAMLLSCFAGCAMQKGEIEVAGEANVEEVALSDTLKANIAKAKDNYNFADNEVSVWTEGTSATDTSWFNAEATEKSYTINTAEAFEGFRQLINDGEKFGGWTIKLGKNINFKGYTLDGIDGIFAGKFDGQGYVICNYKLNATKQKSFFPTIGDATINVKDTGVPAVLENFALVGGEYIVTGSQVGSVAANMNYQVNVTNVYSDAVMSVSEEAETAITKVGGIVGNMTKGGDKNFKNVEFAGSIDLSESTVAGMGEYASGFCGAINGGTAKFTNCVVSGKIAANADHVSGYIAYNSSVGNHTFNNCVNNAEISGEKYVGGFIGRNNKDGGSVTITGCVNNGKITGTDYVGGFIGQVEAGTASIKNCENNASITGTSNVSPIVGLQNQNTTIENCTNLVMAGYQTTKVKGGKYDLRFVAAFNDPNAEAAGFVVSAYYKDANGNMVEKIKDKTVYAEKVYTSIKGTDANGNELTYTAESYGCTHLYTLVIKDVPADYTIADGTLEVLITPFTAVEVEGEVIKTEYGTEHYKKEYRILFIGNSYTHYNTMPTELFLPIAGAAGYKVKVDTVTRGSYTLQKFADPNDTYGAKVHAALQDNKYDYVIIQEQSSRPATDPALFYDGARALDKLIKENGAKTVLYATWGYQTGNANLDKNGLTNETMTWKLAAAYTAISEELDALIAYAGLAFFDVSSNTDVNLYDADQTHPSKEGSYLAALTIFSTIFGESPIGNTYTAGLSDAYVSILQQAAYNAVYNTPEIPDAYKTKSEGVLP